MRNNAERIIYSSAPPEAERGVTAAAFCNPPHRGGAFSAAIVPNWEGLSCSHPPVSLYRSRTDSSTVNGQ